MEFNQYFRSYTQILTPNRIKFDIEEMGKWVEAKLHGQQSVIQPYKIKQFRK